MAKRYNARPSEIVGETDVYAAYCLDEACMYILCKIDEEGRLPQKLESAIEQKNKPRGNAETIHALRGFKGVHYIDQRGNHRRLSDPVDL